MAFDIHFNYVDKTKILLHDVVINYKLQMFTLVWNEFHTPIVSLSQLCMVHTKLGDLFFYIWARLFVSTKHNVNSSWTTTSTNTGRGGEPPSLIDI